MYLSVGIAIYNESSHIIQCLDKLKLALAPFQSHLYLCFNGCSDDSCQKVEQWLSGNNSLPHTLLECEKGKTIAQRTILSAVKRDGLLYEPIVFLDGDVQPAQDCILRLYLELFRIERLLAVGALTVPETSHGGLLSHILNIRNLYPMSEICTSDVSAYKWYVDAFPQEQVPTEWEIRSKIYFHGRCFMLKRADIFNLPDDSRVLDDTYLPNMLHYTYGPGIIRNIYSAKVFYQPYRNIVEHWRTYWRVFNDKRYLDRTYPQFSQIRQKEHSKLNRAYIQTLPWKARLCFGVYRIITVLEYLSYRMLPMVDATKVWTYRKK